MSQRLQRKLALVTAAGQGIGRAIAQCFAAEGARVFATDADEKKLEGLNTDWRTKLDVRSTQAVESVAGRITSELGPLDVLVNCAGYVHQGTVLDCSEQDWDFSMWFRVGDNQRPNRRSTQQWLGRCRSRSSFGPRSAQDPGPRSTPIALKAKVGIILPPTRAAFNGAP
jgi:hypothetical protein